MRATPFATRGYAWTMKALPLLFAVLVLAGCQGAAEESSTTPSSTATSEPAKPTDVATPTADAKITVGMSMADVKKIKGAPNETKHAHGAAGEEIDHWIYSDQTVRFSNGKVAE